MELGALLTYGPDVADVEIELKNRGMGFPFADVRPCGRAAADSALARRVES
jgi:hypothetical protein